MPRPRKNLAEAKPVPAVTRCAIYARVSTREQQEEGYSLDAQLGLLRGYAIAKGLIIDREFVEAASAKSSDRPAFKEMLDLCRRGVIQAIVVEKTDRLTRNLKDSAIMDELRLGIGVEIHIIKENSVLSRTSRSQDTFMHDIRVVVAKNYIDNLREEAIKGMMEKASQGIWPSRAPIGYRNVSDGARKVIEPDPKTAPLIEQLFKAYASGEFSLKKAGEYARRLGLVSVNGKRLHQSSVHWILRNPIYIGKVLWGGKTFAGIHAPLVDRATFDRAQAIMAGKVGTQGGGHAKPIFAYRGLFRCGVCGCAMSPYIVKGQYKYYACTGAKGCRRDGIREEEITAQVAAHLEGLTIRPEVMGMLQEALKQSYREQRTETEDRRERLEKQQRMLRDRLDALYVDKLTNQVPKETYDRMRVQWESELDDVNRMLAAVERAGRATYEDNLAMLDLVSNSADTFKNASDEHRREMLTNLVSNSQILAGRVMLEMRPWFKLVLEANAAVGGKAPEQLEMGAWWAVLDGMLTKLAA